MPIERTWRRMLEARPVRNGAARAAEEAAGLRITVPRRRPGWLAPPLSWIVAVSPTRTLLLDRLARRVWDGCDGKRSVEEIVEDFAREHRLSFHEARVSVTALLKMMLQRGALAMLYADGHHDS